MTANSTQYLTVNQYQFKDIQPILGYSYMRQIILDAQRKMVSYVLEDTTTGLAEGFNLSFSGNAKFVFEGETTLPE